MNRWIYHASKTRQAGEFGILIWRLFTCIELGYVVHMTSSVTGQRYRNILMTMYPVCSSTTSHSRPLPSTRQCTVPFLPNRNRMVGWTFHRCQLAPLLIEVTWSQSHRVHLGCHQKNIFDHLTTSHQIFKSSNLREQWDVVRKSWIGMSFQHCQCLVKSMSRRLLPTSGQKGVLYDIKQVSLIQLLYGVCSL